MGLWRLLGGEINWNRVAREENKWKLWEIRRAIGDALDGALMIDRYFGDDKQNNVMWVLENFGREIPTWKKYPLLDPNHDSDFLKPKSVDYYQPKWDEAWEWYDAKKAGSIPFLEFRIKIREEELAHDEENLKLYKNEIVQWELWKKGQLAAKPIKPNRLTRKLIKTYEKDIPKEKAEIAQLKQELEPLKQQEAQKNRLLDLQEKAAHHGIPTREIKAAIANKTFDEKSVGEIVNKINQAITAEKKQNQSNNHDSNLENENLRLKKEILELQLKLGYFKQ